MQDNHFKVWSLFLAHVLVTAGALLWIHRFEAVAQFDTASYRDYSFDSLSDALDNKRTFVYPAVLRMFQMTDGSERLVPWAQFMLAAISSGVFLATLIRCGWNGWLGLAATAPMLTNPIALEYTHILTPDLIAQSLAIITVSIWLHIVYRGVSVGSLIGIALVLFLTYQTKPSYLFLVAWVPLGGWIARWWLFGDGAAANRIALGLFFASVGPFIAWCGFRFLVVGHFGLVSFGGYNIIGVAGQLLQDADVEHLSEENQVLAEDILARRRTREDWPKALEFESMERLFNATVWEIAVPAAEAIHAGDSRKVNRQLADLSKEILRLHANDYLRWLMQSIKHAIRRVAELTLRNPIVLLAIPLLLIGHAWQWRRYQKHPDDSLIVRWRLEFQVMVWLALAFCAGKLMLVLLVEPPNYRYCAPAAVFLPSILTMDAVRRWIPYDIGRL